MITSSVHRSVLLILCVLVEEGTSDFKLAYEVGVISAFCWLFVQNEHSICIIHSCVAPFVSLSFWVSVSTIPKRTVSILTANHNSNTKYNGWFSSVFAPEVFYV